MDAMGDFLDSTELMEDGPALARRLEHDGYLFVRGLLPRDAVMEVRRRLLEKAAEGGWLDLAHPVRLAQEGREGVWRRLVEEAEASVADDEREG